ncbi:hypothetical protein TIFTF001_043586 [Ficus carica]|uniref:Uncharacterized protein n=1 Tax=Ficus carica TaxID=3494 RepID=A0AA88CMY5_FICCA|nr:hypothetical protein TIFTF001_043580 [Ficus carica]GMN22831.1 hypothetical protein TIFTF001_043581 [Ficus carica]GMN22856.1 hypothetical protein TIFTF001_043585 [Ficus carica]GMN22868.1 hypothetical protein TIFTF001_043586 [Ficus carica]
MRDNRVLIDRDDHLSQLASRLFRLSATFKTTSAMQIRILFALFMNGERDADTGQHAKNRDLRYFRVTEYFVQIMKEFLIKSVWIVNSLKY